jgi:hypothetical protein
MANDWLRDSCTYRAIFQEGFDEGYAEAYSERRGDVQLECRRAWHFCLGRKWLGYPSEEVIEKIEAIKFGSKLEDLVKKLSDNQRRKISTWDELLAAR